VCQTRSRNTPPQQPNKQPTKQHKRKEKQKEFDVIGVSVAHARRGRRLLAEFRGLSPEALREKLLQRASVGKFSSTETLVGTLLGAARRHADTGLQEALSAPCVVDFRRWLARRVLQESVRFPAALSVDAARRAATKLKAAGSTHVLALFSLCWSLAARVSDVLSLRVSSVAFPAPAAVRATFSEGKGAQARGQAYTVEGV